MENLNLDNCQKVKQVNCEIYSRISGYYRPVMQYNKAKKEEFSERKMIDISAFTGKKYV